MGIFLKWKCLNNKNKEKNNTDDLIVILFYSMSNSWRKFMDIQN